MTVLDGPYDQSYPPSLFEPNPRITSLSPNTGSAAAGAIVVTVNGQNFTAASVVEINQAAQATTFVSATRLTVSYDPTAAGAVEFTVRDGEGESNSVTFTVGAEVFDPGRYTVAEVLAYADEHPDEVQDVYDAENAGKARVTLLEGLAERGAV